MARRCNCCARPVDTSLPEARLRTVVYSDPRTGAPYLYAALWECRCQNTLAAVLWEDEESALDSHAAGQAEAAVAVDYEHAEGPYDAAVHRGFFSLTHELASRGL
jgi:hypothetical protein